MIAMAFGPGERRLADEHLVQHAAEAVDVAPGVDVLAAERLLRAHVVRRADGHAGLGQLLAAGLAHRPRDAEVGDQRVAAEQQDVLRLDVAVDDAALVGVLRAPRRPRGRSGARRGAGAAAPG